MLASVLQLQLLSALTALAAPTALNYTVCDAYTQVNINRIFELLGQNLMLFVG